MLCWVLDDDVRFFHQLNYPFTVQNKAEDVNESDVKADDYVKIWKKFYVELR